MFAHYFTQSFELDDQFEAKTWKRRLVPATSPLESLHDGTCGRDLSREQFT